MSVLFITEYMDPRDIQGLGGVAVTPPVASQTVAIGGASVASNAFNASTKLIRVHSDVICSIAVGGTAPVATAVLARMAAGQTEYFAVRPLDKIAVIANV